MLQPFPKLKHGEVALARAKLNTGHVLDATYKTAINEFQEVYSIFLIVSGAVKIVVNIVVSRPNIECWISDSINKLLHYIHRNNVNSFSPQS